MQNMCSFPEAADQPSKQPVCLLNSSSNLYNSTYVQTQGDPRLDIIIRHYRYYSTVPTSNIYSVSSWSQTAQFQSVDWICQCLQCSGFCFTWISEFSPAGYVWTQTLFLYVIKLHAQTFCLPVIYFYMACIFCPHLLNLLCILLLLLFPSLLCASACAPGSQLCSPPKKGWVMFEVN